MTYFSEKFPFSGQTFLTTFFLVIDQVFRIFPFFFPQIFRIFTMLNVVYDPFLTRKTHFFYSVHTFTYIQQHYTSQNIGGTDAWAVPPPQILGDRPPSSPRSPPMVTMSTYRLFCFKTIVTMSMLFCLKAIVAMSTYIGSSV